MIEVERNLVVWIVVTDSRLDLYATHFTVMESNVSPINLVVSISRKSFFLLLGFLAPYRIKEQKKVCRPKITRFERVASYAHRDQP